MGFLGHVSRDPSLQEICTLKAVALSQFQLSNLWPFGKKKTKVREEKKPWCLLDPPPTSQHTQHVNAQHGVFDEESSVACPQRHTSLNEPLELALGGCP